MFIWNVVVGADTAAVAGPGSAVGSERGSAPDYSRLKAIAGDMKPGVWHPIPDTCVKKVFATKKEVPDGYWGRGPEGAFYAWTGAATDGRKLFFWGGGHRYYGGNEVYAFDLEDLEWERVSEPQVPTAGEKLEEGDEGYPSAAHTYDGLCYSPQVNRIFVWGYPGFQSKRIRGKDSVWAFDTGTYKWTWVGQEPEGAWYSKTAIDPVTGNILRVSQNTIFEFDIKTHEYKQLAKMPFLDWGVGAVDPKRKRFVVLTRPGRDHSWFYCSLEEGNRGKTKIIPEQPLNSGTKTFRGKLFDAGMIYNRGRDSFVMWPGGREVYLLNAETWEATRYPNPEGPAPTPGKNGVYSKWFYVEEADVYIGYYNIDENVWLYRLPEDPPPDVTLEAASLQLDKGESTTISWSTEGIDSLTADGAWSGDKELSGQFETGPLAASRTYSLAGTGDLGGDSASLTIAVRVEPDPPDGQVGYWPFEEGYGDVTIEGTREMSCSLFLGRNAGWGKGVNGGGLVFTGKMGGHARTVDAEKLRLRNGKAVSMAACIRVDQLPQGNSRIAGKGNHYGGPYWLLVSRGHFAFRVRQNRKKAGIVKSSEPLPTGRWVHVAGTWSASSGKLDLYLGGRKVASKDAHIAKLTNDKGKYASAGFGVGGGWKGRIDELRVFNKKLSQAEVRGLIKRCLRPGW